MLIAIIFSLLTGTLKLNAQLLDQKLLYTLNNWDSPFARVSFSILSGSVNPAIAGVSSYYIISGYIKKDREKVKNGVITGISVAFATGTTTLLKYIIRRPRPYLENERIKKMGSGGGPSFPSGHTTAAFSLATCICAIYQKPQVCIPAFLWSTAAGISRIYLGVHYPTDVFGGMLIGTSITLIVFSISQFRAFQIVSI